MKKIIHGLVCFLLIMSCGFEGIPESITIKGNPGLYIPLGSPFAGGQVREWLEDLNPSKLEEMMGGADDGPKFYDYKISEEMAAEHGITPNIQTYLVKYPLTKMSLNPGNDIFDAMENANPGGVNIPSIPGLPALSPGDYYYFHENDIPDKTDDVNKPFLRIPLKEMEKSISKITRDSNGRFGLEIAYNEQFKQHLQLKIPAFGIDSYKAGEQDPVNPAKLLYVNEDGTDFEPNTALHKSPADGEILVYARISGLCSGELKPKMLFEWKTAEVIIGGTNNDAFKMEYPIGNSLGDFLGDKASFKKVEGYVFMHGLKSSNDIKITVDINNNSGYSDQQKGKLTEKKPEFNINETTKIAEGNITDSSFTSDTNPVKHYLDLAPIFKPDDAKLSANIDITSLTITHSEESDAEFGLYVLIPLELEVHGDEAPDVNVDGVNIKQEYVILDLGDDAPSKAGTGDDLFGRKDGDDKMFGEFGDIEYVEIILRGVDITIDGFALLIKNKDEYSLLEFKENESLKFDGKSLDRPFNPNLYILMKKDKDTTDKGSLKFLRSQTPRFDFKIDVRAKAKIEHTIKF